MGTKHDGKTVEERDQKELLAQFNGWEDEVIQLLQVWTLYLPCRRELTPRQCIEKPSRWVINALKGLPVSVSDRDHVALAGDAAHAMTPHQGSGAGQAIEDAYVLAALLAHPSTTLEKVAVALKVYEMVRLQHANGVMRGSAMNGRLYEFADPRFAHLAVNTDGSTRVVDAANASTLLGVGQAIKECTRWRWETDVEDDKRRAIELLEEWVHDGNVC